MCEGEPSRVGCTLHTKSAQRLTCTPIDLSPITQAEPSQLLVEWRVGKGRGKGTRTAMMDMIRDTLVHVHPPPGRSRLKQVVDLR